MHPTTRLGDRRWTDLPGAGDETVVLVPVGSFEQHGPHLPLDTDTRIAEAVAERAATRIAGAVLGPTLTVTASGEHSGFPGTLSIGTATTATVIVELVRSADWAAGVVLVNGHGGNATAVSEALRVLRSEGRQPLAWWPRLPDGVPAVDLHAGWTETSVMLHLHPALVDIGAAESGASVTIRDLGSRHLIDVTPNGVLGDPTGADPTAGERIIDGWVDDLVTTVATWAPTPR